jgi:hypothetical protein
MKVYLAKPRHEQLALVYGSVAFSTSLEEGMSAIAKKYYDKAQSLRAKRKDSTDSKLA